MVSVISNLVAIATVLAFATFCACSGYHEVFYYRHEYKKSHWWYEALTKARTVFFSMQVVCILLAVTLMVLTTKRLNNLV